MSSNTIRNQLRAESNLLYTALAVSVAQSNALYTAGYNASLASNVAVTTSNTHYPSTQSINSFMMSFSNDALQKAVSASNRTSFGSNLVNRTSNLVVQMTNFGSNATVFSSNVAMSVQTKRLGDSNTHYVTLDYARSLASNTSNVVVPSSNLSVANSNFLYVSGQFSSNTTVFGSNTSAYASDVNNAIFSSLQGSVQYSSNASVFASNASFVSSNTFAATSNDSYAAYLFGSGIRTHTSNLSSYSSNFEIATSNALYPYTLSCSNNAAWVVSSSLTNSNFSVALSNGVYTSATNASNATAASSNASVGTSNSFFPTAASTSNSSTFGSNAASFSSTKHAGIIAINFNSSLVDSNLVVSSSNSLYPALIFSSNNARYSCNLSTSTSNSLHASSNSLFNSTSFITTTASSSNTASYDSNVSVSTSNSSYPIASASAVSAASAHAAASFASNLLVSASNVAFTTATYASNASVLASNGPLSFASSAANSSSNSAYTMIGQFTANATSLSTSAIQTSNSVSSALSAITSYSNTLYPVATGATASVASATNDALYARDKTGSVLSFFQSNVQNQMLTKQSNLAELISSSASARCNLGLASSDTVTLASLLASSNVRATSGYNTTGASMQCSPLDGALAITVASNDVLKCTPWGTVEVRGAVFSNDTRAYQSFQGISATDQDSINNIIDPSISVHILNNNNAIPSATGSYRSIAWEFAASVVPSQHICSNNIPREARFVATAVDAENNVVSGGDFVVASQDVCVVRSASNASTIPTTNGMWYGTTSPVTRALLVKTNGQGDLAWAAAVDITSNACIVGNTSVSSVCVDSAQNVYALLSCDPLDHTVPTTITTSKAGVTQEAQHLECGHVFGTSAPSPSACMLLKYDSNGTIQWASAIVDASSNVRSGVLALSSDGATVYATSSSFDNTVVKSASGSNVMSLPSIGGASPKHGVAICSFSASNGLPNWTSVAAVSPLRTSNNLLGMEAIALSPAPSTSLYIAMCSGKEMGSFTSGTGSNELIVPSTHFTERVVLLSVTQDTGQLVWANANAVSDMSKGPISCCASPGDGGVFLSGTFGNGYPLVADVNSTSSINDVAFRKAGTWENEIGGHGCGIVKFSQGGIAQWAAGQWGKSPDTTSRCVVSAHTRTHVVGARGAHASLYVHSAATLSTPSHNLPSPIILQGRSETAGTASWVATYDVGTGSVVCAHELRSPSKSGFASAALYSNAQSLSLCGDDYQLGLALKTSARLAAAKEVQREGWRILRDSARSPVDVSESVGTNAILQRWDCYEHAPYTLQSYGAPLALQNAGKTVSIINADTSNKKLPVVLEIRDAMNSTACNILTINTKERYNLLWTGTSWRAC